MNRAVCICGAYMTRTASGYRCDACVRTVTRAEHKRAIHRRWLDAHRDEYNRLRRERRAPHVRVPLKVRLTPEQLRERANAFARLRYAANPKRKIRLNLASARRHRETRRTYMREYMRDRRAAQRAARAA